MSERGPGAAGPVPPTRPAEDLSTLLAVGHLWGFLHALRRAGLGQPPPKQADFLRAIAGAPPRDITRLHWYARLTLLTGIGELELFDKVFDDWFRLGRSIEVLSPPPDEDGEAPAPPDDGNQPLPPQDSARGDGTEAAADTATGGRTFGPSDERRRELLRALGQAWPGCLPTVRSRRWRPSRSGRRLDMRAIWRQARRTGGEIVRLRRSGRPPRSRRLLMLVDVSGSLRQHSPELLRVAHSALRAVPGRTEVFTFGTRLTRVSGALSHRDPDRSLLALSQRVPDADGGTAIGAALEEFLGNPRFLAFARGAFVIVVSDGLERGDPGPMIRATDRLSRLGHRLVWWSPLACSPGYRPLTRGMAGQLHHLDRLGGVRDLESALAEVRRIPAVVTGPRRAAGRQWRQPGVPLRDGGAP